MTEGEVQQGPRLSDAEFFGRLIDTDRPGLTGIPRAVADGDVAGARRLFAADVRATLQPERLLSIPRWYGGRGTIHPGETAAEVAERALRLELMSCGTMHRFAGEVDWFANPTHNQYREWTWQLSRHPEWAILGERYRETGDERYAAGVARLFGSWVRQAVVPQDAPGNATLCWRTIEAGIRMGGTWHSALHACYRSPAFTDDLIVDWFKSVWEHAWRLHNFHWTHNWLIMEMNGLAQIAILYPQFREAVAWREYAFARLVEELARQFHPDGVQFELSTNYHQVVIRNYETLRDVCAAYEVATPPEFDRTLELAHAANVLMMAPDGRLPDLNDGFRWEVASLLQRAVVRYPDRADFRWAATRGEEGAPPAATSLAFPYAGYYVMRTGWEPDAVWALFDGGPLGFAHQHEDKLNLILHAYGRDLLTEGGNYAYDDSEMRRYVLSTRSHNTIRVDGLDQQRRPTYDHDDPDLLTRPAGARWRTTADYDAVEAEYAEGYGPDLARPVAHRRCVIFLKRGLGALGPCLLVIDRLLPTDDRSHDYQALWHLDAAGAVSEGFLVRSADAGLANLAILPSALPGLRLSLVAGQTEPEWQGWRSPLHEVQGTEIPAPTAIYEWRVAGPSRLATLLYPTRPGASCPATAVVADADPAATAIIITLADGATLALDEGDYPLD
ncbi:MAG: alginate lyase family protein [Chloroflexia bacterium]